MRSLYLLLLVLVVANCSSTEKVSPVSVTPKSISIEKSEIKLSTKTSAFGDDAIKILNAKDSIFNSGDLILQQVLNGYPSYVDGMTYSGYEEADIIFRIREVQVKRSYFTLNLPKPGPIYKVVMHVEIIEHGRKIDDLKYAVIANMAEINFKEKPFKWLSRAEVRNPEYQVSTFEVAIRKLYQNLYFDYFDISLLL